MNRVLHYLHRNAGTPASASSPSDQQLLEKYLHQRDQEAFAELVRRHELSVLKACRQVLRSPVDVDDAFQATFLVLLRRARQIRWQPSIQGWLIAVAHRIAVRLAISQKRSATVLKSYDISYESSDHKQPGAEVSWQEACAVLHEELNGLRDAYRLPLLLCYLQGLSRDEAAEQLGWSLGSVKAGLERGRAQLKSRLERRGITLSAGLLTLLALPLSSEASILLAQRTVETLTGNISPKISTLAHQAIGSGLLWNSRSAVLLTLILLTSATGLALAWTKQPLEFTSAPRSPITMPLVSLPAEQTEAITVTGIVLDPLGAPAADSKVLIVKRRDSMRGRAAWPRPETGAITDAQGRFQLTVNYAQFHLIATRPGYGLDFVPMNAEKARQPVQLRLAEELPVQGVVTNETNQPLEGVQLSAIVLRKASPDALEEGLQQMIQTGDDNKPYQATSTDYLLLDSSSLFSTRSDTEGRFFLRGLPAGGLIQLAYEKKGLVSKAMNVALLKGLDGKGTAKYGVTAEQLDEAYLKRSAQSSGETIEQTRKRFQQRGYTRTYEGPSINIAMKRGVRISGFVRNLQGEPISGVSLYDFGTYRSDAITDEKGFYQLDDVKPSLDYTVEALPHGKYLAAQASAMHRDVGPIRIDFQLRAGTTLRGHVIDGKTGRGVRATIEAKPTPGNPLLSKPNVLTECSASTDDLGNFTMIAPAGDIIVTASPIWDTKQPYPYVPATILPSHSGLLRNSTGNSKTVVFEGQGRPYWLQYAYQLLELPAEGETIVELTVSHGQERTLILHDPQGKPINSATMVSGLDQTARPVEIKQSNVQIVAMSDTEKGRNLFVMDRAGKRGAMVYLSTSDTNPLTVRLEPLASLTLRVVDGSSKPRAGFPIAIQPVLGPDRQQPGGWPRQSWQPETLQLFFPTFRTDQEGRVTLTDILPNVEFRLYSPQPDGTLQQFMGSSPNKFTLQPGEQRNAGNFAVNDPYRPRQGNGR